MSQRGYLPQDVSITISFGYGSFEQGFPVRIRLLDADGPGDRIDQARTIPPAASIPRYYQDWKTLYEQQSKVRSTRVIDVPPQSTQRSVVSECRQAAAALQAYLEKTWFKTPIFEFFEEWISARTPVQEDQSVPVVFEFDTGDVAQDSLLKRLPWSCWRLFNRLSNIEPTLASSCTRITEPLSTQLKILAIYGSDEGGLNLEGDNAEIQEIEAAGAHVTRTLKPNRRELHHLLTNDTEAWNILFFAGHSFSNPNLSAGSLQIGDGEGGVYQLQDLLFDLQNAVKQGLKIAIFNSCDGLGIADYLTKELQIPCVLVFKEAVPDKVAREFLKAFLKEFKKGTPLYRSVRAARRNIAWMESDNDDPYPCASWLPVVYQNPIHPEFVWDRDNLSEPAQVSSSNTGLTPPPTRTIPGKALDIHSGTDTDVGTKSYLLYILGAAGLLIAALLFVISRMFSSPHSPSPDPVTVSADIKTSADGVSLFGTSAVKDEGLKALTQEPPDYDVAISTLVKSLKQSPNDPEAWVLLNNAIASKKSSSLDVVDIAVALPLQLETEDVSLEMLRGIAQAQSEFNCVNIKALANVVEQQEMPNEQCQGTDGKMLRVEMSGSDERRIDDNNQNALAVAQYLSSQDSIVAVIGHFSSSASLQAAPEYATKNLVAISPISTSVKLANYPNFFRTPPSDTIAAQDLAQYATEELGIEKIAIAHITDGSSAFSVSFAQEFRNNLPSKEFVYEEGDCSLNKDFGFEAEKCVESAVENGAAAILLVPDTKAPLEQSLKLAAVETDIILLGADSVYHYDTQKAPGILEKQVAIAVPWHRSDVEFNSNECERSGSTFEQDACELYKQEVNWRSAMSYDAVKVVTEVLKKLGGTPSRIDVLNKLNELRSTGFESEVAGRIQLDSNGDRIVDDALAQGKLGVLVTVDPDEGFVHLKTFSD